MTRPATKRVIIAAATVVMLVGIYLAVRPLVADLFWTHNQVEAIEDLSGKYKNTGADELDKLRKEANDYNAQLAKDKKGAHDLSNDEYDKYLTLLGGADTTQTMGAIEIPSLGLAARILYGTSETTLMAGVGHCEWSSLPVGGASTHCVLSGHSGMEDCRMFDNLADLQPGDHVYLTVLGEDLAYEVESVETVLPSQAASLAIQEDRDLLTLVTCVPYGVNSHRLLVHCARCDHLPDRATTPWPSSLVLASAKTIPWVRLVPVLLVALVLIALIVSIAKTRTVRERRFSDDQALTPRKRSSSARDRRRRRRNYRRRGHGYRFSRSLF